MKLGKKFTEIYELLKKVYGDDYMNRTQVYTFLFNSITKKFGYFQITLWIYMDEFKKVQVIVN